jgi:uncharacterized cupredoxin-like copper-binding protein
MVKKILLILFSALVLTACRASAGSGEEITVVLTDFAYNPNSITVPIGKPVRLIIANEGVVEHDFVIEKVDVTTNVIEEHGSEAHHAQGDEAGYDFHVATKPGETSIVEITIHEAGTYEIFCSVPGHKDAGMVGELTVLVEE